MTKGVVYAAFGKQYAEEAGISAVSFKNQAPQIPITIFTDQPIKDSCFDQVVKVPKLRNFPVKEAKIFYMSQSPYDKTLFLDTDTYICEDISELFDLLDSFDLAAAHSAMRISSKAQTVDLGVPAVFPEFNTGVILFKKKQKTEEFFKNWVKTYRKLRNKDLRIDQPSFRKALFRSKLRIATLPPEYNFRTISPSCIPCQPKIIHARRKIKKMLKNQS